MSHRRSLVGGYQCRRADHPHLGRLCIAELGECNVWEVAAYRRVDEAFAALQHEWPYISTCSHMLAVLVTCQSNELRSAVVHSSGSAAAVSRE